MGEQALMGEQAQETAIEIEEGEAYGTTDWKEKLTGQHVEEEAHDNRLEKRG
jgi:hypothetical protein